MFSRSKTSTRWAKSSDWFTQHSPRDLSLDRGLVPIRVPPADRRVYALSHVVPHVESHGQTLPGRHSTLDLDHGVVHDFDLTVVEAHRLIIAGLNRSVLECRQFLLCGFGVARAGELIDDALELFAGLVGLVGGLVIGGHAEGGSRFGLSGLL